MTSTKSKIKRGKEKLIENRESSSDSQSDGEKSEGLGHVFTNRCLPNMVIKEITRMKQAQEIEKLASLDEVGFSTFKNLQVNRVLKSFMQWGCASFDPSTTEFILSNGGRMKITPSDVQRVYALPMGPNPIQLSNCSERDMQKLFVELNLDDGNPKSDKININSLLRKLPSYTSIDTWRKGMILCVLGYLLCPPTNYMISLKYATVLKKPSQIQNFNWCAHVVAHLQKGIGPDMRYPNADWHFLMIHYVDRIGGDTGKEVPTAIHWKRLALFKTMKIIQADFGFAGIRGDGSTTSVAQMNKVETPNQVLIPINPQSCNNLKQCEEAIRCCEANIAAWSNCLQSLRIKQKELTEGVSSKTTRKTPTNVKRKLNVEKAKGKEKAEPKRTTSLVIEEPTIKKRKSTLVIEEPATKKKKDALVIKKPALKAQPSKPSPQKNKPSKTSPQKSSKNPHPSKKPVKDVEGTSKELNEELPDQIPQVVEATDPANEASEILVANQNLEVLANEVVQVEAATEAATEVESGVEQSEQTEADLEPGKGSLPAVEIESSHLVSDGIGKEDETGTNLEDTTATTSLFKDVADLGKEAVALAEEVPEEKMEEEIDSPSIMEDNKGKQKEVDGDKDGQTSDKSPLPLVVYDDPFEDPYEEFLSSQKN